MSDRARKDGQSTSMAGRGAACEVYMYASNSACSTDRLIMALSGPSAPGGGAAAVAIDIYRARDLARRARTPPPAGAGRARRAAS